MKPKWREATVAEIDIARQVFHLGVTASRGRRGPAWKDEWHASVHLNGVTVHVRGGDSPMWVSGGSGKTRWRISLGDRAGSFFGVRAFCEETLKRDLAKIMLVID
jgi:hypothetical protein